MRALHPAVLICFAVPTAACGSSDEDTPSGDVGDSPDPAVPPAPMGASAPSATPPIPEPGATVGPPVEPPPLAPDGVVAPGLAMNECGLETAYPGDEFCILPPPDGQGFQIHYGPSDYDNPDEVAQYLLEPGGETNIYADDVSGNDRDVFFYKRQYRMRPGSHHLIVSETGGSGGIFGTGRRLGGSQNSAKDNPAGDPAPENVGIGIPLGASVPLSINLHHFNGTTDVILKEAWINFWYVDAANVTEQAEEMFLWAFGPSVAPGESVVVTGSHTIDTPGRVLTMYGHRHSNSPRFSAYRMRGGNRELVYSDFNWFEPEVFEFNSRVSNPLPDAQTLTPGGYSGILDLQVGDTLDWECEVVNERDYTITFGANEAESSEMCILIGDAVGPTLRGF